ncbi:hypothetical protein ABW07_02450 [Pluralibacter gergoviae]|nr:hypothetical protein ABW07_02450 [Pluralibacter gergoviae]
MTIKYPNNINVRNMYTNILLADKNYLLGLEQLKIINKVNPKPVSKLTECMLVERNDKDAASCYKYAASLFEKIIKKMIIILLRFTLPEIQGLKWQKMS